MNSLNILVCEFKNLGHSDLALPSTHLLPPRVVSTVNDLTVDIGLSLRLNRVALLSLKTKSMDSIFAMPQVFEDSLSCDILLSKDFCERSFDGYFGIQSICHIPFHYTSGDISF